MELYLDDYIVIWKLFFFLVFFNMLVYEMKYVKDKYMRFEVYFKIFLGFYILFIVLNYSYNKMCRLFMYCNII